MGTKLASESGAPLLQQLVAVGIILAWSGLSVIAQVASMIAHTDLRLGPFIVSRIFHALLAGLYTVFFYHLLEPRLIVSSVFTWNIHTGWATTLIFIKNNILLFFSLLLFLIILSLLLLLINLLFRHIGRSR